MLDMLLPLAGSAAFILMLGLVVGLARQGTHYSDKDAELIDRLRA